LKINCFGPASIIKDLKSLDFENQPKMNAEEIDEPSSIIMLALELGFTGVE
jgi:hypothetical protein